MSVGQAPAVVVDEVRKVYSPSPAWLSVMVKSPVTREIVALRSVSCEVAKGEICAVVGPNGAGKTTLFRVLMGLTTPSAGSAQVLGYDVVRDSLNIRRLVGWMPTSTQTLFSRHTAAENLRFHGRMHGLRGTELNIAVGGALELVGLEDAANQAVVTLSAGMAARLQLARALLHDPQLLILDEPTASVDPVAAFGLINLLGDVVSERGIAAIVSSHRLDEIETLHSHVLLMHQGEILFDGDLDNLRARLDRPHLEFRFSDVGAADSAAKRLAAIPGVISAHRVETMVSVVLSKESRLGPILGLLDGAAAQLIGLEEKRVPLRELLAEVYGVESGDRTREERE